MPECFRMKLLSRRFWFFLFHLETTWGFCFLKGDHAIVSSNSTLSHTSVLIFYILPICNCTVII